MERSLELTKIGETFKNQFGYPSRWVEFFDPWNGLKKEICIHEKHAGHNRIWEKIEKFGFSSKFLGEIKIIKIDHRLIKSVRKFKYAEILTFKPEGMFVIVNYSNYNEKGNLQMALKDQLYQYVESKGESFDADILDDDEFLIEKP
jgi:hypothetical protein